MPSSNVTLLQNSRDTYGKNQNSNNDSSKNKKISKT